MAGGTTYNCRVTLGQLCPQLALCSPWGCPVPLAGAPAFTWLRTSLPAFQATWLLVCLVCHQAARRLPGLSLHVLPHTAPLHFCAAAQGSCGQALLFLAWLGRGRGHGQSSLDSIIFVFDRNCHKHFESVVESEAATQRPQRRPSRTAAERGGDVGMSVSGVRGTPGDV